MKGLFIKDLRLTLSRKQTLVMFVIISIVMGMSMGGSFIITYTAMLMAATAVGTISYDEFDNGFPFLFSLPVDVRTYVREKFIFCQTMELIGIALGTVILLATSAIKKTPMEPMELAVALLVSVCVLAIMCSSMIYIQLKYGAEKSRTVMMVIYGLFALGALGLKKLIEIMPAEMASVLHFLASMQPWIAALAGLVISAAVSYSIYLITLRMMSRREF